MKYLMHICILFWQRKGHKQILSSCSNYLYKIAETVTKEFRLFILAVTQSQIRHKILWCRFKPLNIYAEKNYMTQSLCTLDVLCFLIRRQISCGCKCCRATDVIWDELHHTGQIIVCITPWKLYTDLTDINTTIIWLEYTSWSHFTIAEGLSSSDVCSTDGFWAVGNGMQRTQSVEKGCCDN